LIICVTNQFIKMKSNSILISNANIITPYRIIPNGNILIENGIITKVSDSKIDASGVKEIDALGKYVAPGFIDIHVHGGGGYDFMDTTIEAFIKAAEMHARHGTTSMLPTTVAGDMDELEEILSLYEHANKTNLNGSQFLGLHLEGPYFAKSQAGAQNPIYIKNPDPKEYQAIVEKYPFIKRWSSAPELEGGIDFGRYLVSKGIVAAMAHTDAVYEEALKAFENGYSLVTHLYSGMSGVTRRNAYRYAGLVESAYLIDELDIEMIADGIHLPPPLLKLIYKIKGPSHIALVTDAMRGAGMPDGDTILGSLKHGMKVIIEDGVAKLLDRTAFAGSVATTDRLVRNMINLAGVPLTEAVRMMTSTPAAIMGVENRKGSLMEGKDADLVIFDQNIAIDTTIIGGKVVYSSEN
jgi:N-acetylglucosamine-6-phosphate deacetylase